MATCSNPLTSSGQQTTALSNRLDAEITETEIRGYLMKRSRFTRKWTRRWFVLKNCNLYYSQSPQGKLKKISLADADISETRVDKKQYAFLIKSKQNGRTYYIHSENELTQNSWMQAICFAKAAGRHVNATQSCSIQ